MTPEPSRARPCAVAPLLSAVVAALALAGCATPSIEQGVDGVRTLAGARGIPEAVWTRTDADRAALQRAVSARLAAPLTADAAVEIAVRNHPGIQAAFAELGVARADLAQAARLPNPRFSTMRTRGGEGFKYETSFTFPILGILTLPAASRMERRHFEAVQWRITDRLVRHATETRQAWTAAVAAQASVRQFERIDLAADAGAELMQRMAAAGNASALDALREQAFRAETQAQLTRARSAAIAARERLIRALGLAGDVPEMVLPERLPTVPPAPLALTDAEAMALERRPDVVAAKRELEGTARALGLVKATRFVNALEFGPATVLEHGEATKKGYELSVEIPLFDWGGSRVARAEAIYLRAAARVAETAVNARSEVRESHARYRMQWTLAKQYGETVLPLARRISEETLLRYNGMHLSVFELLADAREQVRVAQSALEATRDFWLAEADLQLALGGPSPVAPAAAVPPPAASPEAASDAEPHTRSHAPAKE